MSRPVRRPARPGSSGPTVRPGYVPGSPGPTPTYVPEPPAKGDVDDHDFPAFPLRPIPDTDSSSPNKYALQPGAGSFAAAIAAAAPGATIVVPPGIYTESFEVTKALNFMADGQVSIIGDGTRDAVTVAAQGVTFEGFSIEHITGSSRTALTINSGSLFLINCRLKSKTIAAVRVLNDASLRLLACEVIATGSNPALAAAGEGQVVGEQCTFTDSTSVAVSLKDSAVGKFTQCHFERNGRAAVSSVDATRVYFDSCRFVDCQITLSNSGAANIVTATTIERQGSTGVLIEGKTVATIAGNILAGSRVEAKDRTKVHLTANEFIDGSLVVAGESEVNSVDDSFKGRTPAAVGIFGDAVVTLAKVKVEEVDGCGVVVYEDAKLTVTEGTVNQCGQTGIMAHSGAKLILKTVEILNCGEVGLIATDTKETSFDDVTVEGSGRSGAELCRARQCKIVESKFLRNARCGIIFANTTATVEGGEFTSNGYSGIHAAESTITVTKAVVTANEKGGLYAVNKSNVKIVETPFTSNRIAGITSEAGATIEITASEFEGNDVGITGEGAITAEECSFKGHTQAAIVATARIVCENCSWAGEPNVAVSAGAGAQFSATGSKFRSNKVHVEASAGGSVTVQSSEFAGSQGSAGVHIADGTGTFTNCQFTNDKAVAIFSEGTTVLNNATVRDAGRTGIVFDGKARGKISNSTIEANGECGCQCFGGTPEIVDSDITAHSRFGIYIFKGGRAIANRVKFDQNQVANVWRE